MGKIADYLEQRRQEKSQTVATFAKELNKTAEALIGLLLEAGVKKACETEQITEADKKTLLRHLQKTHRADRRSRKKITISRGKESQAQQLMKAVSAQVNGAEWESLQYLMEQVIGGHAIDPSFQVVVNLIVAKSFARQSLPVKKLGRPKSQETDDLAREVAQAYWDFLDGGKSYSAAVQLLAGKFHKDERQIMRYVEKYKKHVGLTFKDREIKRDWVAMMYSMHELRSESQPGIYLRSSPETIKPALELELDDFIEYFDEQIVKTVQSLNPTGIK